MNNYYQEWKKWKKERDKADPEGMRECLKCNRMFRSLSKYNRLCDSCKRQVKRQGARKNYKLGENDD